MILNQVEQKSHTSDSGLASEDQEATEKRRTNKAASPNEQGITKEVNSQEGNNEDKNSGESMGRGKKLINTKEKKNSSRTSGYDDL